MLLIVCVYFNFFNVIGDSGTRVTRVYIEVCLEIKMFHYYKFFLEASFNQNFVL